MYPLYNLCSTVYQLLMVTIGSEDITIVIEVNSLHYNVPGCLVCLTNLSRW